MNTWQQKENVLRERRTTMAAQKKLIGPNGKIGIILRAYGHPIMREESSMYDVSYLDDPYDFVETDYEKTLSGQPGPVAWRDEILEGDGAGGPSEDNHNFLGYVFDGLSRGIHMEIQYMRHTNTMTVHYKGYEVYREVSGELFGYAPFKDWEDLIERLYTTAKDKYKLVKEEEYGNIAEKLEQKKASFWQKLRMRWGI